MALSQNLYQFQNEISGYSGEYDSLKNFANEAAAEKAREKELQGSELLTVVQPASFGLISRALERANISGRVTGTLDDIQGSLSPLGASAFRAIRNIGGDILGSAPYIGEVGASFLQSQGDGDLESAMRPRRTDDIELEDFREPDVGTGEGLPQERFVAVEGGIPAVNELTSSLAQNPLFDPSSVDELPDVDVPSLSDAPLAALGTVGGELRGAAGTATRAAAIAGQSVADLVSGDLPAAGILAAADQGLARLGETGSRAAGAITTGVGAAQVVQGARSLLPETTEEGPSVFSAAGEGIRNAIGISTPDVAMPSVGDLPNLQTTSTIAGGLLDEASGAGSRALGTVTELAGSAAESGEGLSGAVSGLAQTTLDSLAEDEDPVGAVVSLGLGIATAITAGVEEIKDLFDKNKPSALPPMAIPTLEAGVTE